MDKFRYFLAGLAIMLFLVIVMIVELSNRTEKSEKVDNSDKNLVVYTVENGEMVEVKAIVVSTNGIERIVK